MYAPATLVCMQPSPSRIAGITVVVAGGSTSPLPNWPFSDIDKLISRLQSDLLG